MQGKTPENFALATGSRREFWYWGLRKTRRRNQGCESEIEERQLLGSRVRNRFSRDEVRKDLPFSDDVEGVAPDKDLGRKWP